MMKMVNQKLKDEIDQLIKDWLFQKPPWNSPDELAWLIYHFIENPTIMSVMFNKKNDH